jgi:hypothetical protein
MRTPQAYSASILLINWGTGSKVIRRLDLHPQLVGP